MCGIAGVLYADRHRPADAEALCEMGRAIAHRGPDATGWHVDGNLGLVHRRLAIIDLAGGDQPLGNEDGSVQVVFNGEIYNHAALRSELKSRGHRFRTQSDTEVLVHLYEEHGPELVRWLRGMFAFALWDAPRRRLLLARDRLGQKPLFVYRDNEKFVFGSELKAILAHADIDRSISAAAVRDYLTFGFVPGEQCIFSRIAKLPAAHWLTVDADHWHSSPQRYWRLEFRSDPHRSLDVWKEQIDAKLAETIRAHCIADVPVGAFLSGGLDSSVVVANLCKDGSPLRTFSVGFAEQAFNELPYARQVAEQFGTQHVEEIVRAEAVGGLDALTRHYDEPFADPSALPTLRVAQVAAEHVKVVLSGDGGDEAFGGYTRYGHDLREARARNCIPAWLRRNLLSRVANLWPRSERLPRPLRLKSTLTNLALDPATAYANTLSLRGLGGADELLRPEWRTALGQGRQLIEKAFRLGHSDPLTGMLAADTAILLPDVFLTKVDRASMAYGLEVRPPLVDHELLELTATLPSAWKIRGGETKWLLKEIYADRLPRKLARRPKQGFEIPVNDWLRGPLRPQLEAFVLANRSRLHEFVRPDMIRRLAQRHQNGGRNGHLLWTLLVFGRWLEEYTTPWNGTASVSLAATARS